jgi:hypothetical protein
MTKKEAKELSLEVWRYLARHPKIELKVQLPDKLYGRIRFLRHRCPLCEVFKQCDECPLHGCSAGTDVYVTWVGAMTKRGRKAAAEEIVRRIEAWEIGDDG